METDMQQTIGVILAGGQSRRMGGGDKALADLGGRSILARIIDRLAPQLPALLLNANDDPIRFSVFGLPVIPDAGDERPGPLAGILAALDLVAMGGGSGWVLSVPCDTPFLPRDLALGLHAGRRLAGAEGAVAASAGRRHPAVALWPLACRDEMRAALEAGQAKVETLVLQLRLAEAEWDLQPYDPFLNVNDPAGLETAVHTVVSYPDA